MLVSVVADVHGNFDALARAAEAADRLVILGDLLDYVDYNDPAVGILGEIFGPRKVTHFTDLRARGAFAELRQFNEQLWHSIPDAASVLSDMVRARYADVLARIPTDTVVTLGNVDVAEEWRRVAGDMMPCRDGEVVDIDGVRFGFVAGGARRSHPAPGLDAGISAEAGTPTFDVNKREAAAPHPWQPFLRAAPDYHAVVDGLPEVDVLCSHIPPNIALLRYDTVPARCEMAGPGLLAYIDRQQPVLALSGHVHQPLVARVRRGRTECINVGHFRRSEVPLLLDTDAIRPGGSRVAASPASR